MFLVGIEQIKVIIEENFFHSGLKTDYCLIFEQFIALTRKLDYHTDTIGRKRIKELQKIDNGISKCDVTLFLWWWMQY